MTLIITKLKEQGFPILEPFEKEEETVFDINLRKKVAELRSKQTGELMEEMLTRIVMEIKQAIIDGKMSGDEELSFMIRCQKSIYDETAYAVSDHWKIIKDGDK